MIAIKNTNIEKFRNFISEKNYDIKDHQLKGFEWCYEREKQGGGLLCDEMGLGKTLLMIACMKINTKKNTLIVVPKSLIGQWRDKIIELLGKRPQVFHGAFAKSFIYNNNNEEQKEIMSKRIFITTYGMLKSVVSEIKWDRIIYDEAHNMRTKGTRVFKNALNVKGDIKWMVTGTPVQNSWKDVLTLCKLLDFPEGKQLLEKSANKDEQRAYIQNIMLVRTKKQVKIKMPTLKVSTVKVEPSTKEEKTFMKDLHSKLLCSKLINKIHYTVVNHMGSNPLNYMLRAKQCCSYARMVDKCIQKLELLDRDDKCVVPDLVKMSSSKLNKIVETIESYDKSVKKLIFYTFNKEMEYLKLQLLSKNYTIGVVNGKTSVENKKKLVTSNDYDVLMVQIKSGSDGLNLQQYSQVYFVSPHWNPAVEQQAIARIYRIGQLANKVDVFYFVSTFNEKNTFTLDEYCLEIKRSKQETINYLFNKEECPN
jgi:SNF2 family DNA or RNA helicase